MRHNARKPARDSTINVFHDPEIRREQDVEVALHDQRRAHQDCAALVAGLDYGAIVPRCCLRESVEVGGDEPVGGEVRAEDVEELH